MGSDLFVSKMNGFSPVKSFIFLIIFLAASIAINGSVITQSKLPREITLKKAVSIPPLPTLTEKSSILSSKPIHQLKISLAGDSLHLSWSPVRVDTAGNNELISYYEVFRDTTPYFTPSLDNRIAVTTDTTYLDILSGLVGDPAVNHFYAISARDTSGNVSLPSAQVCEYDMTLPQGWSIFSLPIIPPTTDLSLVLKDQLTGGPTQAESDLIYFFDPIIQEFRVAWYNTTTESWEGDLNELLHQRGYLVYIRPQHASPVISLLGTLAYDVRSMQIYEGWNLIGYPFTSKVSLDSSRLTNSGFVGGLKPWESDRIYKYRDQTYLSAWLFLENAAWYGEFSEFETDEGYWLLRLDGRGEFTWQCTRPKDGQDTEEMEIDETLSKI